MACFETILHPTDFSENGRVALPLLEELVRTSAVEGGARVHVIHVLEPMISTTDFTWAGLSHSELEEKRLEGAREALEEYVSELDVPRERIVSEVVRGKSHEAIADYAVQHDVDLVVMATHGHTGLSHLLLGSTAELVVRTCPCPVLTVKHPQSRPDHAS